MPPFFLRRLTVSSLRLGAFAAAGLVLASGLAAEAQMPPKQVGVVELKEEDVPRVVTMPGRAVAGAETGIRPRVSGMVTEILYRGGTQLEAGTPMFRIEATTYEAGLASAEADVSSARAAANVAQSAYDRGVRLVGSGLSAAELENTKSTLEQAQARLSSAEAALRVKTLELDWTTVVSPIAGMASVATVSVGDLVTANQATPLATVTRLDPIDVDVYEPSSRMLGLFDDIASGRLKPNETIRATLTLENGQTYSVAGELLSPGFTVSTTTGAVDNRFRFENPDRRLLPGMFVRGQIEIGVTRAILVSQSAATRDRTGQLTAFVIEDGKAVQRPLVEDGTHRGNWIVVEGVRAGEMLVVDGFNGLAPGMAVVPVPVTIDDKGLVQDQPKPAEGAAPAATPKQGG